MEYFNFDRFLSVEIKNDFSEQKIHTFLCNLLEKRYVILIISWHCSLGGNFLADTLRYLSWPALSKS